MISIMFILKTVKSKLDYREEIEHDLDCFIFEKKLFFKHMQLGGKIKSDSNAMCA